MPYRNGNRPTWRIDRSFGIVAGVDVGSFNVSTGTDNEKEANEIEAMLDKLSRMGKHGAKVLKQIATKQRRPIDVLRSWDAQEVKELHTIIADESLETVWSRFLKDAKRKNGQPLSVRTRWDYGVYLGWLLDIKPDATVADLPTVLDAFRTVRVAKGQNATFRKMKAACLAFARNTQDDKQHSALWREISKIDGADGGKVKKDHNLAMRVYECRALIAQLPEKRMQNVCWTMALTGMHFKELVRNPDVLDDRVVIHGQKNANRERTVPLLAELALEPFSYYAPGHGRLRNNIKGDPIRGEVLNATLLTISNRSCSGNVFRHCYELWLKEAGIPEWRVRRYMGHSAPAGHKIDDEYARTDFDAFLHDDTRRLVDYIRKEWKPPKAKPKAIKRLQLG